MISALRPRFYHYCYTDDVRPRYSVHLLSNACTRHINVEFGAHQFQVVWTKRAYRGMSR